MNGSQLAEIAGVLRSEDDFLVAAHVRPDGDALGAALFVTSLLARLGKRARYVIEEEAPDPRFRFLEGYEAIVPLSELAPGDRPRGWAVVLDAPIPERLGQVAALLPPMERVVNIDHHESNIGYGRLRDVRPEASSTCEILYDLVAAAGLEWDRALATAVYTGISFDTGRFRFSNTTPESFEISARLVRLGASPDEIAQRVFYDRSAGSLTLLAEALSSVRYHAGGRVATMVVDRDIYTRPDNGWRDLEGFVDYPMWVTTVEAAAFLKRAGPARYRVSLRSRGDLNVSLVARTFGGGGHGRAAGCTMEGELDEVRERLVQALAQGLEAGGGRTEGR